MTKREKYFQNHTVKDVLIDEKPSENLGIVITIPALREEKLIETLESLTDCDSPNCDVEVVVLVNQPKEADAKTISINEQCFRSATNWISSHQSDQLRFFVLREELEIRYAGVGLARKILMDEAARRLSLSSRSLEVIVGLDADCTISANYLIEIERFFLENEKLVAAAIHFEHVWNDETPEHQNAIIDYELHLRYYIEIQRYIGFPFAIQTVGSAMAVRCEDYILQRGMNKRKAGEDFYFLQKFIELGRCGEIRKATVYPSGRISDRVPFGTGKAVQSSLDRKSELDTYHIHSFQDLQQFFLIIPRLHQEIAAEDESRLIKPLPTSVQTFLKEIDFTSRLKEIRGNSSDARTFEKRFFRYFNAFMLMKYVHFARDHYYPNQSVSKMAAQLCDLLGSEVTGNSEELLHFFRQRAEGI